ncbi:MAG: hypothetical protein QM755_21745 [Luteolibacter sp.]
MKAFFLSVLLLLSIGSRVEAEQEVSSFEWEESCNGATVVVTREHGRVLSIEAEALHSRSGRCWQLSYDKGCLPTVVYKQSIARFYTEGDRAGELMGYELTQYRLWSPDSFQFIPSDARLFSDLKELLEKVRDFVGSGPNKK